MARSGVGSGVGSKLTKPRVVASLQSTHTILLSPHVNCILSGGVAYQRALLYRVDGLSDYELHAGPVQEAIARRPACVRWC